MAKTAGVDGCVSETVKLMRCTSGWSRAAGCGAEFLAMRKCSRSGGRELISEPGGGYAVAPGKAGVFGAAASLAAAHAGLRRGLRQEPRDQPRRGPLLRRRR